MSNPKLNVDFVAVLPVGPRENLDFLKDTIDSIQFYTDGTHHIVLLDDSQGALDLTSVAAIDGVTIFKTVPRDKTSNTFGTLFKNICDGIQFTLDRFEFKILLRMDVDALFVGPNPYRDVIAKSDLNEKHGLFGSFKINGLGNVCNWVTDRTLTGPAMRPRLSPRYPKEVAKWLLSPLAYMELNKHIRRAEANGYTIGDFVVGGIMFWTSYGIQETMKHAMPFTKHCAKLRIPEDYLFTLFAFEAGLDPQEYGRPDDPTAYNLNSLPFSPEEIVRQGKSVVHSTRGHGSMSEADVRKFFREIREAENAGG